MDDAFFPEGLSQPDADQQTTVERIDAGAMFTVRLFRPTTSATRPPVVKSGLFEVIDLTSCFREAAASILTSMSSRPVEVFAHCWPRSMS